MSETEAPRKRAPLSRLTARVQRLRDKVVRPRGSALVLHLVEGDDALFRQQRRCLVALEGAGAVAPSPLTLLTSPRPWPAAAPVVIPMLVRSSETVTERWLSVCEELGWGLVLLADDVEYAKRQWAGSGALVGRASGAGPAAWCLDEASGEAAVRVSLEVGWAPPVGACAVLPLAKSVTPARVTPLVSADDAVAARGMAVVRAGALANRAVDVANRVAARLSGR